MQTQTSKQFQQSWLEHQRSRHNNPDKYKLVSTGLFTLDDILGGGYELGQYVLIGGAQKSGKTTLLMKFMKAAALQDKHFIWFGAEMNNLQLGTMIFSNITGIERSKIRRIGLEMFDWPALEQAGKDIEEWDGYFNYGFATMKDIETVLKEVEDQSGKPIDIVFGDYIQLMESPTTKGGRSYEIEAISRSIKHLTLDRKQPMACVFAAQLNRESIRGSIVDANAFLGSGSLERDMDLGMIIHDVKDENNPDHIVQNQKDIIIVGSRETATGDVRVLYNGATAEIRDMDLSQRPEVDYWS
jgi:replicative DNA helicase